MGREAFGTWGISRRGWQPTTVTYYRRRVEQAERWLHRHREVTVERATTRDLEAWLDTIPPVARTRNTYLAALVAYFDWYASTGMRRDNPARGIGRLPEKPTVPRALDPATVSAMLAEADRHPGPYRTGTYVMAYAGLRIGETVAMRWADIEGSWLRVCGKGARTRTVPVHPELADVLAAWRSSSNSAGWVFPSPARDGDHVSDRKMREEVVGFAAAVGVTMVPHQLRHAAATRLLECGADVATVSAFLGHASLATTSVYVKVRPIRLESAVGRMTYLEETA